MAEISKLTSILPLKARLYRDSKKKNLDLQEITNFLEEKGLFETVLVRDSFLKKYGEKSRGTAKKLVETRVRNPESKRREFEVAEEEIKFEKERIKKSDRGMTSVLYDGYRLSQVMTDLLPEEERTEAFLHIIFTDRFFGTWKPATQRYHSRVSVYGLPTLISTTGIVDAPARPKGFHRIKKDDKERLSVRGQNERFRGEYVEYDDERLTEIMKGYALHAVFYHLSSWPFCEDNKCRLYNPHLQKNILAAQLTRPELCKKHQKMLQDFKDLV